MRTSEARLRAQKKYDDAHRGDYKHFDVKCHREDDKDVIEHLETIKNKSGYLKELVRKDMADGK